jgi:hypothetical protein
VMGWGGAGEVRRWSGAQRCSGSGTPVQLLFLLRPAAVPGVRQAQKPLSCHILPNERC